MDRIMTFLSMYFPPEKYASIKVFTVSCDISEQMATSVKHFRQPTISGSAKVTHIFKNQSSDYENIVSKEWEKNIIENLGLTKQGRCKDVLVIYGTLKSKPEAERTEAIGAYLHHKLKQSNYSIKLSSIHNE